MAFVFALAEILLGATAYLWFVLAASASSFGVGWLGRRLLRSRLVWVAGASLACVVVVLRFVDLNPAKPFRRFYLDLNEGQSEASVMESLNRHFPVDGRFARPTVSQGSTDQVLTFTLDPHDADYDSEFVYVFLKDGRVSRMSYDGD